MTLYEHAMLGIDGALAFGLHRRHGWPNIALAGMAATLPDLDGLTILAGFQCYAHAHRVWMHNLLVAGIIAAVVAIILARTGALITARNRLVRWSLLASPSTTVESPAQLSVWVPVAIVAAYTHLLGDIFFSSGIALGAWGVPLLWPFSTTEYLHPSVPWGDVGATVIFAAGMFAMIRWPTRTQVIAAITLLAVASYIAWHTG